ncbi:MAG: HU family DNA-binding protein [Bacteroidales bacterium]
MAKNVKDVLITNIKGLSKERGSNLNKKEIEEVLVIMKEAIVKTLTETSGECQIDFPGILSISKTYVEAQERTNPASGEKFQDTAKFTVKFKGSNAMKTKIKEATADEAATFTPEVTEA